MRLIFLLLLLLFASPFTSARGVYQTSGEFIGESFMAKTPDHPVLWLRGDTKKQIAKILGHKYSTLRIRYWANGVRTAWILEEIGKERPITVGLVVNAGRLERIKVLEFREIRGEEVRHAFFTDQFKDLTRNENGGLDKPIDGITGATLSVSALTRLAELALFLHSLTPYAHDAPPS